MSVGQRDYQRSFYDSHYSRRMAAVQHQLAHPLFRSFNDRVASRALDAVVGSRDGGELRVLELGCGEGFVATALARSAHERGITLRYIGSDISEGALELAGSVVSGDLRAGDAAEVTAELPAASQDLVVAKNLLHHLDDPRSLAVEVSRVLAPAGRFVAFEPLLGCPQFLLFNLLAPRRERHYFKGQRRNRGALEEAGLEVFTCDRFSWLPYELAFVIRPGVFRRALSTADPEKIRRISRLDDRLATTLPWFACYAVWVAGRS